MGLIGKLEFRAGLMFRRRVRSRITMLELRYQEFSGLIDSWFVVEGPADSVWDFYEWLARMTGEDISEARRAMYRQEMWLARNPNPLTGIGC